MSPLFSLDCLALWIPLQAWSSCKISYAQGIQKNASLPPFLPSHLSPPLSLDPCCGAWGPLGIWRPSCGNVSVCQSRKRKRRRKPQWDVERTGVMCQRETPLWNSLWVKWVFDHVDLWGKHSFTCRDQSRCFYKTLEKQSEVEEKCTINVEVKRGKSYQGKREEATKSSEGVSVGAQCSSTQ